MSYLRQYRLNIKTLSPVFVGCGINIKKKEYIFIPQSRQVLFIDTKKLFSLLKAKGLEDAYQEFVLGSEKDFYKWLTEKKITKQEIRSVKSYAVSSGDALKYSSDPKFTGIQLFIKDGWNCPYIPGSTVKGAIRTALLADIAANKSYGGIEYHTPIKSFLNKKSDEAEKWLNTLKLRDDAGHFVPPYNCVTSVMRGVSVSDSEPLNTNDLTLCGKTDYYTDGQHQSIPMARECIKPGITARHVLTLDTQMLADFKICPDSILKAIRNFYSMQGQYFFSKFPRIEMMDTTPSNGCELFLGGGAGFATKTLVYPMFKEKGLALTSELMKKLFKCHDGDFKSGVSPHMLKCTEYDGKVFKMGRCEVEIK